LFVGLFVALGACGGGGGCALRQHSNVEGVQTLYAF